MAQDTTAPGAAHGIAGWHAHIYYDPAHTREVAARLREKIAAGFPDAIIGRWHDVNVGPHTRAMYQVAFGHDLFAGLVPFLALHREGLTILVHAELHGNSRAAHIDHAIWMGEVLPVNTAQWDNRAKAPRDA
jgi:DOPA 4,5-dioxygenase